LGHFILTSHLSTTRSSSLSPSFSSCSRQRKYLGYSDEEIIMPRRKPQDTKKKAAKKKATKKK